MPTLESHANDTYKLLLSLTTAKGLHKTGLFLLSGEKLIREFLRKPFLEIEYEIRSPHLKSLTDNLLPPSHSLEFSSTLFSELDVVGTHFNILVLKQPIFPKLSQEELNQHKGNGLEVVAPLGDPNNLGALIRSCEAFGVTRVFLSEEAAHPFLPKSVKASAGSVLRVPLMRGPALRDFPKDALALDLEGQSLYEFSWPHHALLVIGEEGQGLAREKADGKILFKNRIRIPTEGVESLNVVVAASLALADFARRRPQ